jgi:cell division transport system permease protein
MGRALEVLRALPEIAAAEAVDPDRMAELLRPWLGGTHGVPLPGVIELRLADLAADPVRIGDRVAAEVPGAVTEAHGVWVAHLAALARAVQGVALAVLALVAGVAAAVVAVAVRAGLSARRDAVLVLHGLGATDAEVAGRFARRVAYLAAMGAAGGTLVALPALAGLAAVAGPLAGAAEWHGLPWLDLALVPPVAALVGWLTTQATVRLWLRRLP